MGTGTGPLGSLNVNAGRAGPLVAWQPDGGLGDADMDQCAGGRSMGLALMTSICVGSMGNWARGIKIDHAAMDCPGVDVSDAKRPWD